MSQPHQNIIKNRLRVSSVLKTMLWQVKLAHTPAWHLPGCHRCCHPQRLAMSNSFRKGLGALNIADPNAAKVRPPSCLHAISNLPLRAPRESSSVAFQDRCKARCLHCSACNTCATQPKCATYAVHDVCTSTMWLLKPAILEAYHFMVWIPPPKKNNNNNKQTEFRFSSWKIL